MLSEFFIVIEPPLCARVKNKMSRAAAPEFLQVCDDLGAIERVAVVNSVSQEMPTFAMRVIENGWIAVGRRNDQCIRGSRFIQFSSQIAERRRRRTVERLD